MTRRPDTVPSINQRGYRIAEAAEYMAVAPYDLLAAAGGSGKSPKRFDRHGASST